MEKNLLFMDLVREDTLISGFCRNTVFVEPNTILKEILQVGWQPDLYSF